MKNFTKEINGYTLTFTCIETDETLKVEVELPAKRKDHRRQMWVHTTLKEIILKESNLDLVDASIPRGSTYAHPSKNVIVEFIFKNTKSKVTQSKKTKRKSSSTNQTTK